MSLARLAIFTLTASFTAADSRTNTPAAMKEPFEFTLTPPRLSSTGEELWDATVKPEGTRDSLPPAFQLGISPPGRGAPVGTAIRAVMRRAERRGLIWIFRELGGALGPPSSGSSGALRRLRLSRATRYRSRSA
jgi:hypothetical protein